MKGFEGWLAVVPETEGWGSTTYGPGHFLFLDSEALTVGQEFKERPEKLTYGRAEQASSRTTGPRKPGGNFTFQPRSNDIINLLMAHFQMFVGSSTPNDSGTSIYTFVPTPAQPDWVGSTFSSGYYTSYPVGDMFTVGVVEKFTDNAAGLDNTIWYRNCVVEQLEFMLDAGEDLKITPTIKARTIDPLADLGRSFNPGGTDSGTIGSRSALSPFEWFKGTLSIAGSSNLGVLDVTSFKFTSVNNSEDRTKLGYLNPNKFDFGRYEITGVVQIDAPTDCMSHLGSMLNDNALAINGTFYNSVNDYIIIDMPNCRYQPFDLNLKGANETTEYGLAFKAYPSADGGTAPIKVTVKTLGMGSRFNAMAV